MYGYFIADFPKGYLGQLHSVEAEEGSEGDPCNTLARMESDLMAILWVTRPAPWSLSCACNLVGDYLNSSAPAHGINGNENRLRDCQPRVTDSYLYANSQL